MRTWAFLLSGMLVWAVHFFGLYGFASIWLDTPVSRALTLALTVVCLAADGWLLARTLPALRRRPSDDVDRWATCTATLGIAFSLLAVLWQGLPALLT
jgi:heme/copper-type cytochrome/quinol oxidase subunit 3